MFPVDLIRGDILAGSKRAEVIAELGTPIAVARRGTHEVLLFPNGVRIELEGEAVIDIKGYVPPPIPAATKGNAAANPPRPPNSTAQSSLPSAADGFNVATPPKARDSRLPKREPARGTRLPATEPWSSPVVWFEIATATSLHFAFTLLALWAAFKYWGMDALWTGRLAIATIDAFLHGILQALGPVTGGFTAIPGVQSILPGIVMIFTTRYFCFSKDLQTAVLTASAVKLAVMLCNILLSIALLNKFFG